MKQKPKSTVSMIATVLLIFSILSTLALVAFSLTSNNGITGATVLGIEAAATSTSCGDVRQSITLISNITYTGNTAATHVCFLINASNVVLDGASFTVTGNATTTGVYNPGNFNNVTIRNMRIYNFTTNVRMQNSANITIFNNTLEPVNVSGTQIGILLQNISTVNITNNSVIIQNATSASQAIYLQDCSGLGSVYANSVFVSGTTSMGIQTENCNSTAIVSNIIRMTGSGFHGILLNYSSWSNLTLNNLSSTPSGINYNLRTRNSQNNIVSLNVINDTVGNTLGAGIYEENELYDTIKENSIRTQSSIGITFSGNHSTIESNLINTSGESANGISISGRNNTVVSNYVIVTGGVSGPGDGIVINILANSSTYINNNITATLGIEISDSSGVGTVNYFIYNNSFGEIRWINETVLDNFDINASNDQGLGLGKNIFIGNNTIAVNTSGFGITREGVTTGLPTKINTSANITLRGIALGTISQIRRVENFTTTSGDIVAAGTNCASPSCDNISYNATSGILTFNVTSFSSFAAQDTAPPAVAISTPVNASNFSGGNRLFNVSITDAYPDQVIFSFDNATGRPFNVTSSQESAPNANFVSFWSATVNLSTVVEGLNRMTVLANDTSGNYNRTESVQFTVDRTPPNLTTFTANFTNSSNFSSTTAFKFEFNVTANDSTTYVTSVRFGFNNGNGTEMNLSGTKNSTQWMTELPITSITDGVFTVTPYAFDSVSNINNTAGVMTFRLDRTPPNVTLFWMNYTNTMNFSHTMAMDKITLNATINDSTTTVQAVKFGFTNGNGTEINLTGTKNSTLYSVEIDSNSITDGRYAVTVYANDSVNNLNNSVSNISFSLDRIPPNVTIVSLNNFSNPVSLSPDLSSNFMSLNATVNDSTTTVQTVIFSINSSNGTTFNVTASVFAGRWNATINLSLLTEGTYSATVYANDTVSNINNSQYVTFLVNHTNQVDAGGGGGGGSGGGGGGGGSSSSKTAIVSPVPEKVEDPKAEVPRSECTSDTNCADQEYCVNYGCTKVFDLKVTEIDTNSPDKIRFQYTVKNIAGLEGDVHFEFWIVDKTGEKLSTGSDIIFVAGTEIQESGILYLSKRLPPGQYTFYVKIIFKKYEAMAYRTFEWDGVQQLAEPKINSQESKTNLFGQAIGGIFHNVKANLLEVIIGGLGLVTTSILVVLLIKTKPKSKQEQLEEWIAATLNTDYSEENIKSLLRENQWDEKMISLAIANAKVIQQLRQAYKLSTKNIKELHEFISASAQQGVTNEQIITALVKRGWNQNAVAPVVNAWSFVNSKK